MTEHLAHAAVWFVLLLALAVYDRPALRTRLAARAHRRWRSTRRTAAALWRAATLHPRQPKHAQEHS